MSLSVRPIVGRRAKISALGTYVPPQVLTNKDLEKMVDTNDQWIMERTGIKERHVLAAGKGVSDICVEAAKKCLAARGIDASEVEVIIVGTVTPDMMFPSTACLVQDKIGAKGAWGFDVSAGCSGFVFALQAGVKLVESGAQSKVLVCGADANTRMTDYTDRATCVLFGDGGGAVLIEPAEEGEIGMIDFVHEIDGSGGVSSELAGGRQPESADPRNDRQEDAFHPPGWPGGLQVRGTQNGGSDDEAARPQRSDGRRSRLLYSSPGEQADHYFDSRPAGHAGGSSDYQY